jgi:hypothetical protein
VGGEGVDGIGKAALLPHLLEEARAHATTQRAVENTEGEPAVVRARDAGHAENEIRLLGRPVDDGHATWRDELGFADPWADRSSIDRPLAASLGECLGDEPHDLVVVEVAGRRHHGA